MVWAALSIRGSEDTRYGSIDSGKVKPHISFSSKNIKQHLIGAFAPSMSLLIIVIQQIQKVQVFTRQIFVRNELL